MAVGIVRATLPRVIGRRKSLLGFRSFEDVWMERERDSEQEEEPWTRERGGIKVVNWPSARSNSR